MREASASDQTLTHVLTRMEARGWIKRVRCEKGATLVLLDEAGRTGRRTVAKL